METAELQGISEHFGEDVRGVFDVTAALAARNVAGGTGSDAMLEQIKAAEKALN